MWRFLLFFLHLYDLYSSVIATVRADVMGQLGFMAGRAEHQVGRLQSVMASTTITPAFGNFLLR